MLKFIFISRFKMSLPAKVYIVFISLLGHTQNTQYSHITQKQSLIKSEKMFKVWSYCIFKHITMYQGPEPNTLSI